MNSKEKPGLGELLRYVGELVEQGAEEHYQTMSLNYRARYTPVLRALHAGAQTVTDITARTHLTQGAISQTVTLLESDGLITRHVVNDGRKSGIQLTSSGRDLVAKLEVHWATTFAAIARLEEEIGYPLRQALEDAAHALEGQGFSARITAVKSELTTGGQVNVE
ncbi:MarR family winged helix-turn-helix transcriptional regulator [Chromobacterium sp. CV08]|uniref:MarR family winged helix-turn-helix transcriptional regulator n=1 Tax=Chromobacterium sp. CV08 TaxID=3133274 RepID=UPI003DA8B4B0